jgi:outer membrane assembly lipoprotein YfiO
MTLIPAPGTADSDEPSAPDEPSGAARCFPSSTPLLTIRPRMERKRAVVVVAGIALLLSGTAQAVEPKGKTWELDKKNSWELVPQTQPAATQGAAAQGPVQNDLLDQADRLLSQRRGEEAHKLLVPWLKEHPKAADRDRGLFLLAEAYRQKGDRVRAFFQLDELLDYYPESRFYYPALEKQFDVANTYLSGHKDRLFLLPILGRQDEAVEMLFRIRERSPGSQVAERALLRTADFYYDTAQYDLASDAYGFYLRDYPRSEASESGRVKLRQAFSSLAQFRGLDFDSTPLVDARAALSDLITQKPKLAEEENLQAVIERIDATMAGKLYRTADFYKRTHQPAAAAQMYRTILTQYPNTATAPKAQQALEKLPASARNLPVNAAAGAPAEPNTGVVPGPDVR